MKKLLTVFAVSGILFSFILGSCKGKDVVNDPKAVLAAFFERMAKKDIDGATKLATKESESTMQMMKKGMEMAKKMKDQLPESKDDTEKFEGATFGDAKIDGDNATVPVKLKDGSAEVAYALKKEGGSWKVDFSMASLMKMGLKEGQNENSGSENGTTPNANGDEHMNLDSLSKLLNSDSLKDAMKKATEALDELKKLKDVKIPNP